MHSILQDIRYGLRQLRKSPSFTVTAILTLAFGIGASTALFSIVDCVLLKPLAYRDSGHSSSSGKEFVSSKSSSPTLAPMPGTKTMAKKSTTFTDLTLLQQNSAGVGLTDDHPRLVGKITALPNLLDILGVQPILGRNFLPEEASRSRKSRHPLLESLADPLQRRPQQSSSRTIQIAGTPYQVVGVLPKNFYFPKANELPPSLSPVSFPITKSSLRSPSTSRLRTEQRLRQLRPLARLKPGVSISQAQENLNALDDTLARQIPPDQLDGPAHGALSTYIQPMKEVLVGKTSSRLWLLMAAVLSVLLIACINLANAQLARFVTRDREAAVRSALGASASPSLQSALAEVLLLSFTGGILGITLAFFAVAPSPHTLSLPSLARGHHCQLHRPCTLHPPHRRSNLHLRRPPRPSSPSHQAATGSSRHQRLHRLSPQRLAPSLARRSTGLRLHRPPAPRRTLCQEPRSSLHLRQRLLHRSRPRRRRLPPGQQLQRRQSARWLRRWRPRKTPRPSWRAVRLSRQLHDPRRRALDRRRNARRCSVPKPQAWPTIAGSAPATSAPSANTSWKAVPSTTAIATPPMP